MTGLTSRRKGNRREREAVNIYEAAGYQVERATAGGFQSPDFFDLFDLMAFCPDHFRFVQVKSNGARGIGEWCRDVATFNALPAVTVEYAVAYDQEGWRLITPTRRDKYVTAYDERHHDDRAMGEGLTAFLAGEVG